MKIVSAYKNDDILRASLNALTRQAFGFDFESWYQGGYFTDRYCPYSLFDGERIVSNVSANTMRLVIDGKTINAVQLGTVATASDCKNRGYVAQLMRYVIAQYKERYELIYLFANDSAKEFYPKFGFTDVHESYRRAIIPAANKHSARKLDVCGADYALFRRLYDTHVPCGRVSMENNFQLVMFYCGAPYKDCVYYIEDLDAAVVVEHSDNSLSIIDVFSPNQCCINDIAATFADGDSYYSLGFSPTSDCGMELITEPFDTLFMLKDMGFGDLYFPLLSRA